MVDFGYAIYHPEVSDTNQLCDAVLAAGCNYLRELCGSGWAPTEVLVPHAKPADPAPYRNLFKVQPRFSSELCALRFPATWMQHPIDGADAERRSVALAAVESGPPQAFLQQVYRALRLLLLEGRNSGDEVAQMLSMHRRTLNRRLKAHGTTFQRVLDDVRFSIARQHLATSGIALDDVAATLGYAGVSPFMRTFQRWTGTTPGRWRRAAIASIAYGGDAHGADWRV
jgi:AraC-like DNA-binding protein